eukprot:1854824-Pyramimonas_sp.AAC.1
MIPRAFRLQARIACLSRVRHMPASGSGDSHTWKAFQGRALSPSSDGVPIPCGDKRGPAVGGQQAALARRSRMERRLTTVPHHLVEEWNSTKDTINSMQTIVSSWVGSIYAHSFLEASLGDLGDFQLRLACLDSSARVEPS